MSNPAERPVVLVTVGTDHHPFDRLMGWAEQWAQEHPEAHVVVQHGASRRPDGVEAHVRIPFAELEDLITRSRAVVTHAGGGSTGQIWRLGKVPIAVPRLARFGEHVDDHQQAFASRLTELGYPVFIARSYDDVAEALSQYLQRAPDDLPHIDTSKGTTTVRTIGDLVEQLVETRGRRGRRGRR